MSGPPQNLFPTRSGKKKRIWARSRLNNRNLKLVPLSSYFPHGLHSRSPGDQEPVPRADCHRPHLYTGSRMTPVCCAMSLAHCSSSRVLIAYPCPFEFTIRTMSRERTLAFRPSKRPCRRRDEARKHASKEEGPTLLCGLT